MIEKIWFGHSPLKYLLGPLLWPLSRLYGLISQRRRTQYELGYKPRYRAPVPVVIVGNITAGGNGKTPVVIWLVEMLTAAGYRPGVVSRGYGGHAEDYPLVVDHSVRVTQSGDEPKLIAERTGVTVVVAPERAAAVKMLLAKDSAVNIIIADDGLQHYALERDIEFVVVDGQRRFGNQQFIPFGPLRESVTRLNEVDFIINNGGTPRNNEIGMTLAPELAVNLVTGEKRAVAELTALVAFAGIGHPPRFFKTLTELGALLIKTQAFSDHKAFSQQELNQLASVGENIIMTEKDAVKCGAFAQDNWWYLPVSAHISQPDQARIMQKMKEVISHYGS